ncbi:MAG: HNH endonuclease, partial [Mycobacterium sp.]
WNSPSGKVYTTVPGSRLLFPGWDTTTAPVAAGPPIVESAERGLQMPRRRRTRAVERACRIRRERALNDAHLAERNRPLPFWPV